MSDVKEPTKRKKTSKSNQNVKQGPGDFLRLIKGKPVVVKLNDGTCYSGTF